MIHYENLQLYLRLGLNLKIYRVLEFNQSQWLKQYVEFSTQNIEIEVETNGDKDGKAFYKFMYKFTLYMEKQWKT